MLKKLGLLSTPEDAFAEGFFIGFAIGVLGIIMTVVIVVMPILTNCVYWPKPLYPFGG
jgi:hypothetical protein